jgi:chromate transporter
MQRQVVERFQWLSAREFLDGYALSQLTPGPTMLVSVFVGYRAHGLAGAIVAGAAMFLPTAMITAVIARRWVALRHRPWAAAAERALLPIGIGLMAAGVYTLARAGLRDVPTVLIAAAAGLVAATRIVPVAAVVLGTGVIAWLAAR